MPYTLGRFYNSPIEYHMTLSRVLPDWPSASSPSRFSAQFRRAARLAYNYLQHRLTRNPNR